MATDVLALADRLWRGEVATSEFHPVSHLGGLAEICDGVAFVPAFANVTAVATDDGLVLVDTGSSFAAAAIHEELRRWTGQRLHTAIYSHGHIDHVFGVPVWEAEAAERGWPAPAVIAHEALPLRFDRYRMTLGYNEIINQRQFGVPGLRWPADYRYPDQTYRDTASVEAGGTTLALRHEKGETDDHTVTWLADRRVMCCGDLFIWASPNAGNPQKVQRYPLEWAQALRRMLALEPEFLLPGHGLPVIGADRVAVALADTAELLESLVEPDAGGHERRRPAGRGDPHRHASRAALADRPFLQPVYDEPEFIVRTVWRQYGGWWDGNPATLKPAPERALAAELAAWPAARRRWRPGRWSWPARTRPTRACGSPVTWPSWPGWRRPATGRSRGSGSTCSACAPTRRRPRWRPACSGGPRTSRSRAASRPRLRWRDSWRSTASGRV